MYQRQPIRILGLSLLALVAVMAVNASGAQAEKWLFLLEKEKSVTTLNLNVEVLAGELVVEGLGLTIRCNKGSGAVTAKAEGEKASGSGTVTFTECVVVGAEKVCTVKSKGAAAGTVVVSASGTAGMSGENQELVTVLLSSGATPFTELGIEGKLCAASTGGLFEPITGSVLLTVLEALKDLTVHLAHLKDEELSFGSEPALLRGLHEEAGKLLLLPEILAHISDENPLKTWAIHLVP